MSVTITAKNDGTALNETHHPFASVTATDGFNLAPAHYNACNYNGIYAEESPKAAPGLL